MKNDIVNLEIKTYTVTALAFQSAVFMALRFGATLFTKLGKCFVRSPPNWFSTAHVFQDRGVVTREISVAWRSASRRKYRGVKSRLPNSRVE
jgi:hypothetical protein